MADRQGLIPFVIIAEILGVLCVALTGVWMGHYRGGFAWTEDPGKEFNYHPLFMIIGLVFLYGNGILTYRVFHSVGKLKIKILHASLHGGALVFASVGLKTAFDSHNLAKDPIPNLYTLHSWMGILTVALFALQWILGLSMFLLPVFAESIKKAYKPLHVFFGLVIFILAVATSLAGITEKIIFLMVYPPMVKYKEYCPEGMVVNFLGMSLVAFATAIAYVAVKPTYAREAAGEDDGQNYQVNASYQK